MSLGDNAPIYNQDYSALDDNQKNRLGGLWHHGSTGFVADDGSTRTNTIIPKGFSFTYNPATGELSIKQNVFVPAGPGLMHMHCNDRLFELTGETFELWEQSGWFYIRVPSIDLRTSVQDFSQLYLTLADNLAFFYDKVVSPSKDELSYNLQRHRARLRRFIRCELDPNNPTGEDPIDKELHLDPIEENLPEVRVSNQGSLRTITGGLAELSGPDSV